MLRFLEDIRICKLSTKGGSLTDSNGDDRIRREIRTFKNRQGAPVRQTEKYYMITLEIVLVSLLN